MASLPADRYTVGWICAIPTELTAAKAMLDTTHSQLKYQKKHDENNYTLGSIGEHNIILVCLPRYGTNDAAAAAKSMQSTFPNLRFSLMVGVGGGIPSRDNDIRLGDIVVSVPDGRAGGVIQYDMGKENDSSFHRTGFLNSPPSLLLTAIATLRSIRNLESEIAEEVLKAFPNDDDEKWRFPVNAEDVLFEERYRDGSMVVEIVQRKSRESSNPKCFYGNIGSGNRVIKNARTRQQMADEEKIMCFEMEAAGLMNFFSCIVIRGICDYADSHKHKRWQPYAASVAAAFGKKLLSVISPEVVEILEPIKINKHWIVPRQVSTHFTGRTEILQRMREKLCPAVDSSSQEEQKRFIISAMGGSGKSEVCLKFAHDNRESFWGVFWIDASDENSIKSSFVNMAKGAGKENINQYQDARIWLDNCNKSWLLIFDNADDEDVDYANFFPSGNAGSILMSTRIGDGAQDYHTVGFQDPDFEKLGTEASIELLLKCAGVPQGKRADVEDDARQIVGDNILCQHALAITQAGAYIKKKLSTFKEYPNLFKNQRKELLKYHQKQARSRYGDVYATFEVSAEAMEHSDDSDWKNALELLKVLAFLHREGVQEEIFTCAWIKGVEVANKEPDEHFLLCSLWHVNHMRKVLHSKHRSSQELDVLSFRKARSALLSFSLITVDPDNGDISMHPLVHAWAKDRLDAETHNDAWVITASILKLSIRDIYSYSDFLVRTQSHIESCFNNRPEHLFDSFKGFSLEVDKILYSFTWVAYRVRGDDRAGYISNVLYSRIGREIIPWSRQWREVLYLQALCLYEAHGFSEVFDILEKVATYDEELLSPEDPASMNALGLLCETYQKLGKGLQAIELLERVVCSSNTSHYLTNPQYLSLEHSLAFLYFENKQLDKAIQVSEKSFQTRREILLPTDPDRLSSEYGLGRAYLDNNQIDKAIQVLEEVVQTCREILPSTNPHRLRSEYTLGTAYLENKQVDKGIQVLEEVVQTRREILFATNSERLGSEYLLAGAYCRNDEYQKALPLVCEVVKICSESLKVGHQHRVLAENLLSYCLERIELESPKLGGDGSNTEGPSS